MTVKELLQRMDSKELSEWMAYDMTNEKEWSDKYNSDKELEKSRAMSKEEKLAAFKKLLGGKK